MGDEKKKGGFGVVKLLVYLVLFLGLVAGGVYLYGRAQPEEHMAGPKTRDVKRWPIACYEAVANVQEHPKWCSMIKEVRDYKKEGDKLSYICVLADGTELISTMELGFKPKEIVWKVRDSRNDFTGTWTFKFDEAGEAKTKVSLTEIGRIESPLMRAMFALFADMEKSVNTFLDDLKKKVEGDKPST